MTHDHEKHLENIIDPIEIIEFAIKVKNNDARSEINSSPRKIIQFWSIMIEKDVHPKKELKLNLFSLFKMSNN
jgi:hypothetical protein